MRRRSLTFVLTLVVVVPVAACTSDGGDEAGDPEPTASVSVAAESTAPESTAPESAAPGSSAPESTVAGSAGEPGGPGGPVMTEPRRVVVVVVRSAVARGTPAADAVAAGSFALDRIPEAFVPDGAVASTDELAGVAVLDLAPGTVVVAAHFAPG